MKPFDLQAALAGAKVQTRNGLEVKQFTCFKTEDETPYPIVCVVGGRICSYTASGRYHDGDDMESINDLFMASEKREYWINVWREFRRNEIGFSITYFTKEVAMAARDKHTNYLGDPVKIWEEEV